MYDLIHARGGEQSFNTFWFRDFRYIKVECPENVEYNITYAPYFYPFDNAGSFECSNERYNINDLAASQTVDGMICANYPSPPTK